MVELIVYDKNIDPLGIIDTENSLLWERRFYEAGYFEIHLPPTGDNNALAVTKNYIMRTDARESGVIIYVGKNTESDGTTDVTVIGRFLSYLLHGHIVRSAETYTGNAEDIMRGLVESVCIAGAQPDIIPGLALGAHSGSENTVTVRLEYPDLHDALREIARLSGVGFIIELDPNTGALVFSCRAGKDSSAGQTVNPQVIFSPEYDSIVGGVSAVSDNSATVNAVTMRYSGEFGEVVTRYDRAGATGTELHEICVTTDQCRTRTVEGVTVLDVPGTIALLQSLAPQYITPERYEVAASVSRSGSYEYKTDYDIGDIVTVQYEPFGITLDRRIHKIQENYSEIGIETVPVLGDIYPAEIT